MYTAGSKSVLTKILQGKTQAVTVKSVKLWLNRDKDITILIWTFVTLNIRILEIENKIISLENNLKANNGKVNTKDND